MKKQYLLAAGMWLAMYSSVFAQSTQFDPARGGLPANLAALQLLHDQAQKQHVDEMIKARKLAASLGIPMRQIGKNGQVRQITGIDEQGNLRFVETDNLVAATSVGTTRVWPVSGNGFNLTGKTFRVHEWDGGSVRTTHVEFGGRVTMGDNSAIDFHPTHVAGTIIASGVNPGARGMAYEASLTAYDYNNDMAEMSAVAQDMLVSNHSYGAIGGWRNSPTNGWEWWGIPSVSETQDPKFGVYNDVAQVWDQISYSAPYYLIVKSAGNSRNDGPGPGTSHRLPFAGNVLSTTTRPRNGPYDILTTYTTSKNILTVAAVEDVPNYTGPSSVVMSGFSSWGPTDDGRIKPDISSNGVDLLSTSHNADNSYESSSGTSMASPAVTGSLILLQQHHSNRTGMPMLSSLLKALVCHTADEAGTAEGPDYAFGWGLMNTHRAATSITQNGRRSIVTSKNLANAQVETITVFATGTSPLVATIAWTDPAGTAFPITTLNNRSPRLVNDLDLRIISPGGTTTHLPYTLDFNNPAAAAQKADNIRDNVEKVFVANPVRGNYQINVSHKGASLTGGQQAYGLVVTGIATADTAFTCMGNTIFNASTGIFDDGSAAAQYGNNQNCSWLIDLKDTAASLSLKFDQLSTLAGDTVYIHNGNNAAAPLLGKYSAAGAPAAWINATADKAFVRFVSNTTGTAAGWTIRYASGIRPKALIRVPSSGYSCTGRSLIFSASPLIPDSTGWRYNWTFTGAITPTYTTPQVSVSYAQPGFYGYKLVITNPRGRSVTYQKDSVLWVRPNVGKIRSKFIETFENVNFPNVTTKSDSVFEIIGNEFETWQRTTDAAQQGIGSVMVKNFGTMGGVRELVLPSINMTTLTAPLTLRYYVAHAAESNTATDRLRVLVSTDCGQNWIQRSSRSNNTAPRLYTVSLPVTGAYIPAPADWRLDMLNLNAYQNTANLLIKFEMTGNSSDNLYLDSITVGNQVTSTKSGAAKKQTWMMAIPNPYQQQLNIAYQVPTAGTLSLKLVDMLGRQYLIEQKYRSVGEYQTQLPDALVGLPAGFYMLRLEGQNFISNIKIVKK